MTIREKLFALLTLAIALLVLTFAVIIPVPSNAENTNLYPLCGVVVEVNHFSNTVTIRDFTGNLWSFYGAEDWACGDIAACIMDDMNTEIIYDDMIISVRYCGY